MTITFQLRLFCLQQKLYPFIFVRFLQLISTENLFFETHKNLNYSYRRLKLQSFVLLSSIILHFTVRRTIYFRTIIYYVLIWLYLLPKLLTLMLVIVTAIYKSPESLNCIRNTWILCIEEVGI